MDEIVQVKNVTKRFGEETVLSDLSFSFESGKIYGLVGKNGSGKSVLCKLIAGVLHPNQGEIIVEGVLLEKGVFPPSIGVILDNGYHVSEHNFDRLFKHREDAIMFYLEKQKMSKVKIKNENGLEYIEMEKRIKEKRHKEEQEDK